MYDRTVKNRKLTLCVSGKLWNRSLVMMDLETESLWSHLLGEAMAGRLEGARLETLPSDMVTWGAWREQHPQTTVLGLSRTSSNYNRQFYNQQGAKYAFLVGLEGTDGMYHCNFADLREQPLVNVQAGRTPLVVSFDPDSTSVRVFSRKAGDRILTFEAAKTGHFRDEQTGSTWDRVRGVAVAGPLQDHRLEPHVGIVSMVRAWRQFHPDSKQAK